jgi:hypothetical protein
MPTDISSVYPRSDDGQPGEGGHEEAIGHLVLAVLRDDALDMKAKRAKILKALKLMDDGEREESEEEGDDQDAEKTAGPGKRIAEPKGAWLKPDYAGANTSKRAENPESVRRPVKLRSADLRWLMERIRALETGRPTPHPPGARVSGGLGSMTSRDFARRLKGGR